VENRSQIIAASVLVPLMVVVLTAFGGIITWSLNQKSNRAYEEYKRKEEKYSALIKSLKGFYVASYSKEMREEFLDQLNQCWLYCSDEVIEKAYNFLETVHVGSKASEKQQRDLLGELVVAIRVDLISRKTLNSTKLTAEDFKHLYAIKATTPTP